MALGSTKEEFIRRSPQSRIDFRTATYDELPDYLLSDQADVGVSLVKPQHPGLKSRLLGRQLLVCVLPCTHPLASQASINPQQLSQTAWIGYPPDTPLGQVCMSELEIDVGSASIQVRSPAIALSCAQRGLGAAIVDASCVPSHPLSELVVRPLTVAVESEIWAVTSALHPSSDVAQQFIDALHSVFRGNAPRPLFTALE